jgi:hypothetical protein
MDESIPIWSSKSIRLNLEITCAGAYTKCENHCTYKNIINRKHIFISHIINKLCLSVIMAQKLY